MEKSGSRSAPRATPLIIERPDLQSWQQRFVSRTLTLVFWVGWVYLWLPAITLVGWLAGLERFHFHMIVLEGYQGFLGLLVLYAVVIFSMGFALVLWAKYNHWRFRGVERRRMRPTVSAEALGTMIGVQAADIERWRDARIAVVHHDAHGQVVMVDVEQARSRTHPAPTRELAAADC
ncbi:poly-beta-1,6-N-acetyl-D-glucosamine biosynthesis protein PgaD [Cognatazoarcus halotolerans]|uniref:poly-beta-1,6-N-acetyl-D-glucosamine biosynthesis protein PgaD n=1 Tax=Cognatazoarcus halotolerans TaxID=2686016 RepID=UPI00135B7CB8|nr:poly-beta-1,6-N-acetyl-D-glucosamine biosynthesis protein PgaD [Cognatazoarcus halotolerans]MBX3679538.1 poly-beta-1,6-N-acetyl-D-glucosamine biosynthesis protein PgaD [Rhodocyclaceae bacterium]MCB1900379.1 poly-beta-1,6-N-acetyl-D-glucosamine biosynthesis protein PgaD [Rhodocyclaceae bacterium]MCP5308214.1 poly-beta-1,6-N-acetyl-D-glucosamine biosynthesis protein PgaD [Zoogloeaceae bacterium]